MTDVIETKPRKPLGRKAYGSIGHLPGSRLGPGDHSIHPGQERICTEKARDRHDRVIVTEKLDGSNTAIVRIGDKIWALSRAGYAALTSPYVQHHYFDAWVHGQRAKWLGMLADGEALHGEWMAMAHGTKYDLPHGPFVAFDLTAGGKRVPHDVLQQRCHANYVPTAAVISDGQPISVDDALSLLGERGKHGALEQVEGVVYRVERRGAFDFLGKYVRPGKVDGKYLAEISGCDPRWHWQPSGADLAA